MTALADERLRVAEAHALDRMNENPLDLRRGGKIDELISRMNSAAEVRSVADPSQSGFNQAKTFWETDLDRRIRK